MSIMLAVLTDRSCGEACWHAKEDVCRCECGGANHGILLKDGAEQPVRHSKIDGVAYELIAIGNYRTINSQFYDMVRTYPPKRTVQYIEGKDFHYYWESSDYNSPLKMKAASRAQCVLWSELSAYKGLSNFEFYQQKPYLLWRKYNAVTV